ncbi:hypothetical protein CC1G_06877 [Coprinopsis cinerea okayama7|uniref:Uncharacterized protein n=1 Tax=Coprinopsis cinerea (strain Okayama-7 / 130 / ATCC MYA-4618 / FGSC 9003) TaxID=240176 RepID=A8N705_COPC7|nr:hypothetical protein CC1G_06877 [Coprinopsis cinerea okayama7\|eukprot:XP_001830611.1 hypothetical protein CC1G_06877 [Coprinopsis cinerea okayama7\
MANSRVFIHPSPAQAALSAAKPWTRSAGIWGFGTGAAVFLLLSVTPLVRREVLEKTPGLSWYFEDKTPASDKPF